VESLKSAWRRAPSVVFSAPHRFFFPTPGKMIAANRKSTHPESSGNRKIGIYILALFVTREYVDGSSPLTHIRVAPPRRNSLGWEAIFLDSALIGWGSYSALHPAFHPLPTHPRAAAHFISYKEKCSRSVWRMSIAMKQSAEISLAQFSSSLDKADG
jgi:hypothetical protein